AAALLTPTQIGSDVDWTALDVGWSTACAIRGGKLYCWGVNESGELGDGTTTSQPSPEQIGSATDWLEVRANGGGSGTTCGRRMNSGLYCWGANGVGQVGDGTTTNRSIPTLVSSAAWSALAEGSDFSCGTQSGALYCWGNDSWLGSSAQKTTP